MNFRILQKSKSANPSPFQPGGARNPHNNHIFEKLSKLKSLAETRGFKNQAYCYAKIMKSLSKYPLPILSVPQLIEIDGVGDKTAHLISKLLKKQYEGVLLSSENNDGSCQFLEKEENESENDLNIDSNDEPEKNEPSQIPEGLNSNFFEEYKMQRTLSVNKRTNHDVVVTKELEPLKKKSIIDLTGKDSMNFSKPKSKYKTPDPDSTPASILMSLLGFQSQQNGKYASKKEIKKISEEMTVKCAEISNWSCLKTLLKHDILYKYDFDGVEKYCLSQEGEKMAEKLLDYQMKMMERTQSSLENPPNIDFSGHKEKEDLLINNNSLNPIIERNSSEEKTGHKKQDKIETKFEIPIENIEKLNVVLIVDNREIKNQEDRTYIHTQLSENGLDCELGNLPVGDFLWIARLKEKNQNEIKLFMLDYIVERKKADDLASSILDGRYSSQKARLKKCQIPNAFWLIEGKPSQNSAMSANILETTTFHLQFTHDFKVQRTENLQHTLKWLSNMTLSIQRKIQLDMKSKKPLNFRMNLEDFLLNNAKTTNTIGDIFKSMLTNIKECGKQACNNIYQNYKTPRQMYEKLMSLGNHQERVELLSLKARKENKKLEKLGEEMNGLNIRISLAKRLEILFCEENYPEILVESNAEDLEGDEI